MEEEDKEKLPGHSRRCRVTGARSEAAGLARRVRREREREKHLCFRKRGGERGAEIGHVIERPSHDKVGLVNRQVVVVVTGASHLLVTVFGGGGGGEEDRPPRLMQERDRCFTRLGPRVLGAELDASLLVWVGFLLCNRFLLGWRRRGKRVVVRLYLTRLYTQILC